MNEGAPVMPPVPPGAWAICGLALLIMAWASRPSREKSAKAARPNTFRSQPMEA